MVFLLLSLVFCSGFLYFFLPGVCHSVMAAFNLWYFNLIARRTLGTCSITITRHFTALQYKFLFAWGLHPCSSPVVN